VVVEGQRGPNPGHQKCPLQGIFRQPSSVTVVYRFPANGSKAIKMFAVPFLLYSVSYLRGFPGVAGRGARTSSISCVDISSMHTWGY
jgi:hypothetical protein